MCDVGHHTDIEFAGIHAVLRPTVRGGLQHGMRQASLHHLRQVALHVRGVWRGDMEAGIQHLLTDDGIDGGDHANLQPSRLQNVVYQVNSGGFAICTGDTQHSQLAGRVAVKSCRQVRQSLAPIGDTHVGYRQACQVLAAHHRRSPALDGIGDETVPIHELSKGGYEQAANLHLARIEHHPADQGIVTL